MNNPFARLQHWFTLIALSITPLTLFGASCNSDQLFEDPACAAIFRHINRGEPLPKPAEAAPALREQQHLDTSYDERPDLVRAAPPERKTTSTNPNAPSPHTARNKPVTQTNNPPRAPLPTESQRGPDGLPPEPPLREVPDTRWNAVRYQAEGLTENELIATECTQPLDDWTVFDVHEASDMRGILSAIKTSGNVLVRVHYPSNPEWRGVHDFKKIDVRGKGCVKVLGINDPQTGKRPTVRHITALGFSGPSRERPGGLIIENMRISMGDYSTIHGPSLGGDCIGWPHSARFVVIRNSVISKCQHHAFVTSRAYHQYLEIDGSHFEYAQSHLAYIDRVGFAYIHDSTFQSPGWGHALRCIAARCVIDNVHVSNIELDGSIAPEGINPRRPDQKYVGMNPLDLYMVGGEHILRNSTIDYYYPGNGGQWAAQYRARWGIFSTDLGTHDDESWTYAPYWTQEWFDVQGEPVKPIALTVSNNTFNCLNHPCYMFLVQSSYPRYTSGTTLNRMLSWLRKHQWPDWETMMANAPDEWVWTFSRAYDSHKPTLLKGKTTNILPARIPEEPTWVERGLIIIDGTNTISNPKSQLVRPATPSKAYCWGFWVEGKEGQECQTPTHQAKIIIGE